MFMRDAGGDTNPDARRLRVECILDELIERHSIGADEFSSELEDRPCCYPKRHENSPFYDTPGLPNASRLLIARVAATNPTRPSLTRSFATVDSISATRASSGASRYTICSTSVPSWHCMATRMPWAPPAAPRSNILLVSP